MRKEIKAKGAIFPMPVLMIATYNDDGTVNVMNAAWGTLADRDIIVINVDETHKTYKNILKRKAFTVSLADVDHLAEADYLGIATGNKDKDKFVKSGLTASKSTAVDAPIVNEFPICMECEYIEYPYGEYGPTVVGKIVRTTANENVMAAGGVDLAKAGIIAFDTITHGYYKVTDRVGNAFSDGKKIK